MSNLWLANTIWLWDVWHSEERLFWWSTWAVYATLNLPNDYFCSENAFWFLAFLSKMLRYASEVLKNKICGSGRMVNSTLCWKGVFCFSNDVIIWNERRWGKRGWDHNLLVWTYTFTRDVWNISEVIGTRSFKQNSFPKRWTLWSHKGSTDHGKDGLLRYLRGFGSCHWVWNRRGKGGIMPDGGKKKNWMSLSCVQFYVTSWTVVHSSVHGIFQAGYWSG